MIFIWKFFFLKVGRVKLFLGEWIFGHTRPPGVWFFFGNLKGCFNSRIFNCNCKNKNYTILRQVSWTELNNKVFRNGEIRTSHKIERKNKRREKEPSNRTILRHYVATYILWELQNVTVFKNKKKKEIHNDNIIQISLRMQANGLRKFIIIIIIIIIIIMSKLIIIDQILYC